MDVQSIDVKHFQNEVRRLFRGKPYDEEDIKEGKVFTFRTSSPKATLIITITEKWVGYEFQIDPSVYGRHGLAEENTDLYPLDFNPEVTREIFGELMLFSKNLLDHKIMAGTYEGFPVLAFPLKDDEYRVTILRKKRLLWFYRTKGHYRTIKSKQLADYGLKPVI